MKARVRKKKSSEWKPWDLWRGTVSWSFLSNFLRCRMQTQLTYGEGWRTRREPGFFQYGSMVHKVLEHAYNPKRLDKVGGPPRSQSIKKWIDDYDDEQRKNGIESRIDMQEYEQLLGLAEVVCIEYMKRYPDDFQWKWIHTEEKFKLPYLYPDGRSCMMTGIVDGTIMRRIKGKNSAWIFDTKTGGDIDNGVGEDLPVNFQFNFYMYRTVMQYPDVKPRGLLLNWIRRPGQRMTPKDEGSIVMLLDRIRKDIQTRPKHYFQRVECSVSKKEVENWKENQLDPIMADLRLWYEGPGKWYVPKFYPDAPRTPTYVNPCSLEVKRRKVDLFPALVNGNFSTLTKERL